MMEEFNNWGLDNNKVKWMLEPNKDKITDFMRKQLLNQILKNYRFMFITQ